MRTIRNAVRAIIIEQGRLLVVTNIDDRGPWYLIPGGGQHHGETLADTVRRECLEEVGVEVIVGDLVLVRDYVGAHHEFAEHESAIHQVDFMFTCALAPGAIPLVGPGRDTAQIGIAWLEVERLEHTRLYPAVLRTLLPQMDTTRGPIYLGDVN